MLTFAVAMWCVSSVNVCVGETEERRLMTGLHNVADIHCNVCNTVLGWKYVCIASTTLHSISPLAPSPALHRCSMLTLLLCDLRSSGVMFSLCRSLSPLTNHKSTKRTSFLS